MRSFSILVLVSGLILGPGYYVYGVFFSGSSGGRVAVFSQDIDKLKTGAVQHYSTSNSKWNTPIKLTVSPDMNPVSLILEVTYLRPLVNTRKHRLDYSATLKDGTRSVWNESFSIRPSTRKKVDTSPFIITTPTGIYYKKLLTFKASETGQYLFDLQRNGISRTKVKKITLKVRQNVIQPRLYVVVMGVILSLMSVVLFFSLHRTGVTSPKSIEV